MSIVYQLEVGIQRWVAEVYDGPIVIPADSTATLELRRRDGSVIVRMELLPMEIYSIEVRGNA